MSKLGRLVANKYRILHEIGRGGMGSVWLADHTALSSKVAIKFLDPELADDPEAHARFRREARAAAALGGAHVAHVFDYGIDAGDPYIAMEFLEGETLAAKLRRAGRLPVEDVRLIARQIARGLAKAHMLGIVHRDLKPANVFLVDVGADWLVKLLDFGVAKLVKPGSSLQEVLTSPGQQVGTLNYMSPEQINGGDVDERSDTWAFGALIFECLTGEALFVGDSVPDLIAAICHRPIATFTQVTLLPTRFDAWLERAVCRDAGARERSVIALADSFREFTRDLAGRVPLNPAYAYPTQRTLDAFASTRHPTPDRRVPSSIPAAIDGRRDLNHIGLVASISQRSAVLWTRRRCSVGQRITLTLHFEEHGGYSTLARVRQVSEDSSLRPELWHYEVELAFDAPLPALSSRLAPLDARVLQ